MIEYKTIERVDYDILLQAAELHRDTLGYRSFLTLFGTKFLYRVYETILLERLGFLVVAHEANQLRGFVLGCMDSSRLNSIMLKRLPVFIPLIFSALSKNLSLAKNIWETMFYSQKEGKGVRPELVIIAVVKEDQSKGLGSQLIRQLEEEFKKRSLSCYKVTVHRDMPDANRFYQKNGMNWERNFKLYGYIWNVYVKDIGGV